MLIPNDWQPNETLHIWFFSFLSAAAGCSLTYYIMLYDEFASIFYGVAHLVVFLPAMLYSKQRLLNIVIATILCLLYPFWGAIVGMLSIGLFAPVSCSFVWGVVMTYALRRNMAILIMLLVGVLSNLILFAPMNSMSISDPDTGFALSIYAWYVCMFFAMPWIMSCKRTPFRSKHSGIDTCSECGYSLVGLPTDFPCPECGRYNADLAEKFKER